MNEIHTSWRLLATSLFMLALAAIFLLGIYVAIKVAERDGYIESGIMIVICLAIAAFPALSGLTGLIDYMRRSPTILLRDKNICDRRLSDKEIFFGPALTLFGIYTKAGPISIAFTSDRIAEYKQNPFRFGCWSLLGKSRSGLVYVSLLGLDLRPPKLLPLIVARAVACGCRYEKVYSPDDWDKAIAESTKGRR